jgi:hypothetical protein
LAQSYFGEATMTDADLAASGSGAVAELVQSRNANAAEALAIFRTQIAAFRRRLKARRGYRLSSIAACLALPAFFALLIVTTRLHWIPYLSPFLVGAVAFLLVVGVCRAWRRYYYRICAEIYRECHKADRRFRIEKDGIVTGSSGIVSSIPWKAITDIVVDKDSVMIYLSPIQAISLPKAAFENQDVEAFCAELQRRWKHARAATTASA